MENLKVNVDPGRPHLKTNKHLEGKQHGRLGLRYRQATRRKPFVSHHVLEDFTHGKRRQIERVEEKQGVAAKREE